MKNNKLSDALSEVDVGDDEMQSQRWRPLRNYIAVRECVICGTKSLPYLGFWQPCKEQETGAHLRTVAFLEKSDTVAALIYSAVTGQGVVEISDTDREKLQHWLKESEELTAKRLRRLLQGMI